MKRLLIGILVLVCCIALFTALIPTFVSSTLGKNLLLHVVNGRIHGQLSIDSLDLGWLSSQSIKGVRLEDQKGKMIVSIDQIDADTSLWSLFFSHNDPEPFHLRQLDAEIAQDSEGVTNFEALLGSKQSKSSDFSKASVFLSKVNADLMKVGPKDWTLKAAGITRQNDLKGQFDLSATLGNNLNLTLQAQNFPLLFIDQTLAIKNPQLSGLVPKLLGNSLDIHLDATHSANGQNFHLTGKSTYTNFDFIGAFEKNLLTIQPKGLFSFSIPADQFNSLLEPLKKGKIDQTLSGKLETKAFTVFLLKPEQSDLDLAISLEAVGISLFDSTQKIGLQPTTLGISNKNEKKAVAISLNSSGTANNEPFSFDVHFELPPEFLANPDLKTLLHAGIPTQGSMKSIFSTSWKGVVKEKNSSLNLSVGYKEFKVDDLNFVLDQLPLGDSKNIALHLQSGKEEQISGSIHLKDLSGDDFHINLNLSSLNPSFLQPLLPDQPVHRYVGSAIDAKVIASRTGSGDLKSTVEVNVPQESEGFLKKFNGKFTLEPDYDLTFEISAQQKVGAVQFLGTIQDLFDDKGKLSPQDALVSLKGNMKHFPIALIAQIATGNKDLSQKMEALIGSQIDGDFSAEIKKGQGPVNANIKGINGTAFVEGIINNNSFVLRSPLKATLKITPQLERLFLRESLPLLSNAVSSNEPVELTIAKEGFYLPLPSPSLQNIQIGNAVIDFHKIQFTREGQLGKVASLLGINQNTFEVWFTPLYLSINQGYLEMKRVDMLVAENYPLASWGVVDFNNEALKFTIALTPAALQNAFKVKTSSSYLLLIPVRGSISRPEIDTAKVTARISSLIAQSRGGPEGLVLGTVLDVASGAYTEDRAPSPTTDPLPWSTVADAKKSEPESTPEKVLDAPDKILEQPIKELQKGTKKLLKGLFG